MVKNLTNSNVDRQNILNNKYAVQAIENEIKHPGIVFEGKMVFFKEQVADFFEITTRTIENYISKYESELRENGYDVLKGNRLKAIKLLIKAEHVTEIRFGNINASQIGIFDFRAFLNLAMLMIESDRARILRQAILDIVIDTINAKTGGGTKYINQRAEDFILSWFAEENYRKQFTTALQQCVASYEFWSAIKCARDVFVS